MIFTAIVVAVCAAVSLYVAREEKFGMKVMAFLAASALGSIIWLIVHFIVSVVFGNTISVYEATDFERTPDGYYVEYAGGNIMVPDDKNILLGAVCEVPTLQISIPNETRPEHWFFTLSEREIGFCE